MIARKKASEKMLPSSDKISQTVASEIDPMNDERLEGLRLHNLQPNKRKTTWAERRFENLAKINNGKAIGTMVLTKYPRGLLWSDKGLTVRNKVRCVQTLSSTLPTMINKTRGRTDLEEKRCRRCRKEVEDDQHILSACEMNC